ncbi:MAG: hypothetical protein KBF73_12645 [Flavobacteriales bacterium]|jgi:hypothetical protein|nr:hypothetical protein [Flavobacteriales bacterium]
MKAINTLKTSLIDKILTIENQEFLEALQTIVNSSSTEKPYSFTDSQMQMLQMSEEDVKYGRLTSQEDLDAEDMAWLSEK